MMLCIALWQHLKWMAGDKELKFEKNFSLYSLENQEFYYLLLLWQS